MDAVTTPTVTPSTKRIAAIGGINLATTTAKAIAGFAVGHGWISGGNVETDTGLIVLALTYGYSFWKDYGRDIATAGLTILRAKVLDAAARAQAAPGLAAPALASVAAHVEATTPAGAPVSSVAPPVAS